MKSKISCFYENSSLPRVRKRLPKFGKDVFDENLIVFDEKLKYFRIIFLEFSFENKYRGKTVAKVGKIR